MKHLLIAASLLSTLNFFSQISKGTIMPGLSFDYNHEKINKSNNDYFTNNEIVIEKRNLISLNLNCGYFVKDNFAVGALGGYENGTLKSNSFDPTSSANEYSSQDINSFHAGLYGRYYKMIGNSKFGFFAQLTTLYKKENITTIQNTTYNNVQGFVNIFKSQKESFNIALSPGLVYFINNKIGIETSFASLGYYASKQKNYVENIEKQILKSQSIYTNLIHSSLNIGVNFYFARKKKV